ncbi:hypothetical protein [Paenisporosarcina indica]|uniref:hypothetical protein n=1 Tax=Paenisporosarcina indica TaxID=650093 RepID=UPI00094F4CB5|nr:hypothetical protein [Paenisporosarcina indica]
MKYFLKLNVVSLLFAIVIGISIELQLNFYRIWRLTGWEADTVNGVIAGLHLIGFVLSTIVFVFLISKWLEGKKSSFWAVILWFPYLILFIALFSYLFPITNQGEMPAPVSGLIIIAQLIMYPIYLVMVTAFCTTSALVIEEKVLD